MTAAYKPRDHLARHPVWPLEGRPKGRYTPRVAARGAARVERIRRRYRTGPGRLVGSFAVRAQNAVTRTSVRISGALSGWQETDPGKRRRRLLVAYLVGLPLGVLLLYLAVRDVTTAALADVLLSMGVPQALGGLALIAGLYFLQSERWRFIPRVEAPATSGAFATMVIGGVAANNVVPGRPGDLLRCYWLSRKSGKAIGRATATVAVDRMSDVVTLLALLLASAPFVDRPPWLTQLIVVAVIVAALLVVVLIAAWWYATHSAKGRARADVPATERSFLRGHASALVRGAGSLMKPRTLLTPGALSLLVWSAFAAVALLVASELSIELSLVEAVFASGVINLGVAVPSTPGFVGASQWLATSVLGLFGVASAQGLASGIVLHALWFIPTTIAGVALAFARSFRTSATNEKELP